LSAKQIKKGKQIMRANTSKDFNKVRKQHIDIARDLCYGKDVIRKLNATTNIAQIEAVMNGARRRLS
jgi:hypothetical protein